MKVRQYYYDVYGRNLTMDYYCSAQNTPCEILYNYGKLEVWI